MTRKEQAMAYFKQGYNCSQALVLTFSDLLPADRETLSSAACSFGGGMGRLREVCGAVSGMFLVVGMLYGYSGPETGDVKLNHYARIQELARRFEEKWDTIICRELLGLGIKHDPPAPAPRTAAYYASRPCGDIIGTAAEILEEYITENPLK